MDTFRVFAKINEQILDFTFLTVIQGDSKGLSKNSGGHRGHLVEQLLPQAFFYFGHLVGLGAKNQQKINFSTG